MLLCTDAVAQWALTCLEAERRDALVEVLQGLATAGARQGTLRKAFTASSFAQPLREDDLTLVLCQPRPPTAPPTAPASHDHPGVTGAGLLGRLRRLAH